MIRKIQKHSCKLFRAILDNMQYYLRQKKQRAVPAQLSLEITNICNANCIFCAYQYDKRKKAFMSEDHFRRVIAEYKDMGGQHISLTPILGELFVDKDILKKLHYIKGFGFQQVFTYTNGSLLHNFDTAEILRSGLTHVAISTSPLKEDAYQKIYRNNNYPKVLGNIKELLKNFQAMSGAGDEEMTVKQINIEFRADRSLKECLELEDFQKAVKPYLNSRVSVGSLNRYDAWNGAITQDQLISGMTIKDAHFPKRVPCRRTSFIQVGVNGEVSLCGCRVDVNAAEDELMIGDIKESNLKALYNSKKVKKFKNAFLTNRLPQVCAKCSWYEF